MATATATTDRPAALTPAELAAALGEADWLAAEVLGLVGQDALAAAWARGDVEFGRTKYVCAGNPDFPEKSSPTLIVEDGLEWTGPKRRFHGRLAHVLAESLPERRHHQKYQREVCVNRERDAWEWLDRPEDARGRETRWARRDIDRAEAERLFELRVRLTDKGLAALGAGPA